MQVDEQPFPLLLELTDPRATAPHLVGTKAATLAVLAQAGYPVPPGWVITTAAGDVSHEPDPGARTAVPAAVAEALDAVTHAVRDQAVAVRSSATSEDLPGSSFAGQYLTTLNVRGRAALDRAVLATWRSVGTEQVNRYARELGAGAPRMAVLIQPMVAASAAGVAFSADPVTGDRDRVVINAVAGLGEALVSGSITPETWLVPGTGEPVTRTPSAALVPEQAREVAVLVRRVEHDLGAPQDIEWAIEGGALRLLQARPITGLPDAPVTPIPISIEVPSGSWEHDASHFPLPNYPIDRMVVPLLQDGITGWADEYGYLFDGLEVCEIGGWMYERLRPIGGREGPELPIWVMWLAVRVLPALRARVRTAREAVATDKPGRFIRQWYDAWLPELSERITGLLAVDLPALSDDALRAHLDRATDLLRRGIEIHALVHGSLAPILYELVTGCERLLGWDIGTTMGLVRGTSFRSTEPARALSELATRARANRAVLDRPSGPEREVLAWLRATDAPFAEAFEDYLHRYAHRSSGDSIAVPAIAEQPSLVLALVRDQVARGFDPARVDADNAAVREQLAAAARSALSHDEPGRAEFDRLLDRAQLAYPAREDNEFFSMSAPYAVLRYAVLEVGDRLRQHGVIGEREDVMFLEIDEALDALRASRDLTALVARRKGEFAWAQANPGPPTYGKPSPPPTSLAFLPAAARLPMQSMLWSLDSIMAIGSSQRPQPADPVLRGTPASGGTYTGPVRVITGQEHFHRIRAGDVLVCPITSPVWSVLFPSVGALVTDTGGVLSHPAIIAREYGIPAVVATGNATALLHDGQVVTVDGSTGEVRLDAGITNATPR